VINHLQESWTTLLTRWCSKTIIVETKINLPFLRWAGGKRWLARRIAPILKGFLAKENTYREPFLGSGAMFFALAPQRAVLSDLNRELIETYTWVRSRPGELISQLKEWPVDRETYSRLRSLYKMKGIKKAARFLYLNRTCYGGLFRTNMQGIFNTPYGGGSRTPEPLWRDHLIERAAFCLRSGVELKYCDFQININEATEGDIVYCDPTYSGVKRGRFDRYGDVIFSWTDQERLANLSYLAFRKGVTVLVSNGPFPELRGLYRAAYRLKLKKAKSIGKAAINKSVHEEYLFVLDPFGRKHIWNNIAPITNKRIFLAPRKIEPCDNRSTLSRETLQTNLKHMRNKV